MCVSKIGRAGWASSALAQRSRTTPAAKRLLIAGHDTTRVAEPAPLIYDRGHMGPVVPLLALLWSLVGAPAVLAQTPRPGGAPPDPIEHSRALSLRPLPALPPAAPPAERVVSERRLRLPETGQGGGIAAHPGGRPPP